MASVRKKPVQIATAASRAGEAASDSPPELTPLIISSRFVEDVTAIVRSNTSLVLTTGRLENEQQSVLIPFLEMGFAGLRYGDVSASDEGEPDLQSVLDCTVTLENALWLVFDVMRDIRRECATLRKVVNNEIALDPARLEHARFFADKTREQAELCVSLLEEFSAFPRSPDEPPVRSNEPAPTDAVTKPVRRRRAQSGATPAKPIKAKRAKPA